MTGGPAAPGRRQEPRPAGRGPDGRGGQGRGGRGGGPPVRADRHQGSRGKQRLTMKRQERRRYAAPLARVGAYEEGSQIQLQESVPRHAMITSILSMSEEVQQIVPE